MFKSIGNFFAKKFLPLIISNLLLDVDTVEKRDGYYIRIRVEAYGFKLVDESIKISDQTSRDMTKHEVLKLEKPVDVKLPSIEDKLRKWTKKANNNLSDALKQ